MKQAIRLVVLIAVIFAVITGLVLANEDWQNDTSNLCDAGNVLDGQCNFPDDEWQTQWMYQFGWWWQRVSEGDVSPCGVPVEYGGGCVATDDSGESVTVAISTPAGVVYVVVLQGSSYSGTADVSIASDDFDATKDLGFKLKKGDRLIIHGNDNANYIVGSAGDDEIYGYGGNDTIYGGDGDDYIEGGDEEAHWGGGTYGDTIYGGNGNDTIYGGNETCVDGICDGGTMGDTIDGGDGNDVINGGNESCPDCFDAQIGDTINGGNGNDVIDGGDESNGGIGYSTNTGDIIDGGDGDDTITGGNEVNGEAWAGATEGDAIDGGNGNDTCDAGSDPNDSVTNCE